MDMQYTATKQFRLVAGYVRLLADLLLVGPDLQDMDRSAFAQVMQDLAARLDRATDELESTGPDPRSEQREGQP